MLPSCRNNPRQKQENSPLALIRQSLWYKRLTYLATHSVNCQNVVSMGSKLLNMKRMNTRRICLIWRQLSNYWKEKEKSKGDNSEVSWAAVQKTQGGQTAPHLDMPLSHSGSFQSSLYPSPGPPHYAPLHQPPSHPLPRKGNKYKCCLGQIGL